MTNVTVYGADWCPLTKRAMAHLKQKGVDFKYIDIDKNREGAAWVAAQNGGKEKKPTLDINGQVLTEPTNAQLDEALHANGLL